MNDVAITIEVPQELVERAKNVGIQLEAQSEQIIALLDAQIRRLESAQRFNEIALQLQALPSDLKPTQEEIEAEIRHYWSGKSTDE